MGVWMPRKSSCLVLLALVLVFTSQLIPDAYALGGGAAGADGSTGSNSASAETGPQRPGALARFFRALFGRPQSSSTGTAATALVAPAPPEAYSVSGIDFSRD